MGHSHAHGPVTAGSRHRRPLVLAFALTAGFMVVEFVAGVLTGSLALMSDAAHMATDVIGLGLALAAITVANRAGGSQRTFGFYRLEVLAALANGILLIGVAVWVLVEAVRRFQEPVEIPGLPMLIVAVLGLVVNLVSFSLLRRGASESLNLKAASLEVLGDLLGSIGVIVAAIVLLTTGWVYADAIIGVAVGLFILPRTFVLMRATIHVLLEAAPAELSVEQIREAIGAVPGVLAVHDLHVWSITSGLNSVSGHLVVDEGAQSERVLAAVLSLMKDRFGVDHATMQCESALLAAPHQSAPI